MHFTAACIQLASKHHLVSVSTQINYTSLHGPPKPYWRNRQSILPTVVKMFMLHGAWVRPIIFKERAAYLQQWKHKVKDEMCVRPKERGCTSVLALQALGKKTTAQQKQKSNLVSHLLFHRFSPCKCCFMCRFVARQRDNPEQLQVVLFFLS